MYILSIASVLCGPPVALGVGATDLDAVDYRENCHAAVITEPFFGTITGVLGGGLDRRYDPHTAVVSSFVNAVSPLRPGRRVVIS